ncbi:MAG TPA: FAD binding domain-containing protein [Burkholderiales bacterium]|nr:FAD binding domain-containing protein [Burkholderiales bacterium]
MKAPPFAYVRARTLDDAFELLDKHGEGAKLLAGGQSLIAALNLRLSSPDILIDISRIPELKGIAVAGGKVHIGALTTHAEIERSADIAAHVPLLAQAAPHIAHAAIRNAGTLGGSIATADPSAEWPACCVALDAELVIATKAGSRRVKARDFFKGVYATDLRSDEVLTGVDFPARGADHVSAFLELTLRRGDYAIVGVAAFAKKASGALTGVRLAYLGAGETPILALSAMAAAEAGRPAADVAAALAADLRPAPDLYTTAATKLHLARVLTGRALAALAA